MTVDFTTHVLANPRGREYSYAVRVRGLPYLWTDGKANWTYSAASAIIHGGLGKSDWTFDYKSDPLAPLETGGGITINLIDEQSRRTRALFSPEKVPTYRNYAVADSTGILPTDTTMRIQDTTGLVEGMDLYYGQETVTVVSITNGSHFVATRGRYGTVKLRQGDFYDGNVGSAQGIEVSSLPTVWRGRFVDVYVAPVNEDGTAGQRYTIWAGRLGSYTITGKAIRLSCDSLTASLGKDSWPDPLPSGGSGTGAPQIYLGADQMFIMIGASPNATSALTMGIRAELGIYNSVGTFTKWTTAGWYSLQQIAQALTNTITSALQDVPAGYLDPEYLTLQNNFSITVGEPFTWSDNETTLLNCRNDTNLTIAVDRKGAMVKVVTSLDYRQNFTIKPYSNEYFVASAGPGFRINAQDDQQIAMIMDDPALPMTNQGCYDGTDMVGYAKISQGDRCELISFGTAASNAGVMYLTDIKRGLGFTEIQNWGTAEDGSPERVKIEQVMVVGTNNTMDAANFLLYLLLSVDGDSQLNHVDYDRLGFQQGLAMHSDFVDYDDIVARMSIGDMPRPTFWWVEKAGAGKESLEEFMKLNGIYFVTRRFERDGEYLFGLTVDVVDVPVTTRYNLAIGDETRLADTSPEIDINERLVINAISISPKYKFGDADDAGGKVWERANRSIAKYGLTKSLDIKASATFNSFGGNFVSPVSDRLRLYAALATAVSLRWFGAYASGNYTLEMECPHVGWAIQSGDRVLLDLTGVPNPNGEDGISGASAKVYEVKHNMGKKAGAKVTFRINTMRAAELAPCFHITSTAANPVCTIANNTFSDASAISPFADQSTSFARDVLWFDSTKHTDGAGLRCLIWEEGNFAATFVERTVTATGLTTLTFNSALPAGITGAVQRVLGTFIDYDDPTVLMSAYAYIGSNAAFSKLGTQDASTADVEAFEYC